MLIILFELRNGGKKGKENILFFESLKPEEIPKNLEREKKLGYTNKHICGVRAPRGHAMTSEFEIGEVNGPTGARMRSG